MTHVIDPVVTHHVVPKTIKDFVYTDGTVIELFKFTCYHSRARHDCWDIFLPCLLVFAWCF